MIRRGSNLTTLFLTVLLDMIGVGIVIPILATVILRPDSGVLDPSMTLETRRLVYGLLVAVYPIAQFFGAPLLGALSDRFGRKPILLLSLTGTSIGYLLFALGIGFHSIMILLISRILDGFTGGNISTAMSSIADMSSAQDKAKNFGLIGMAFGFGFIVGPSIGGLLADSSIVSWFTFQTPFWFAAALSAFTVIFTIFRFDETHPSPTYTPIDPFTGIRNVVHAFAMPKLRTIFIVVLLLTIGFNFFTQFYQDYLILKFNFDESDIGYLFGFVGVWIALTQGLFIRPFVKKYAPNHILIVSVLGLSLVLPALLLPQTVMAIYLINPFVAIFQGFTLPNLNAVISNLAGRESQGEVLGISQSMQSVGMAVPPLLAGLAANLDFRLPLLIAGGITFLAWLIFVIAFGRMPRERFHEI
jgi:DHA1 family tetracycline resistance protein-like MFS transporter